MPQLHKVEDIAAHFGITVDTARRWLREKCLHGVKIDRAWFVRPEDVAALLAGQPKEDATHE